jgi:hypothetical protein
LKTLPGILVGHIDIETHDKGIAGYERTGSLGAVHVVIVQPPLGFTGDRVESFTSAGISPIA